jgi:hypothetical protein
MPRDDEENGLRCIGVASDRAQCERRVDRCVERLRVLCKARHPVVLEERHDVETVHGRKDGQTRFQLGHDARLQRKCVFDWRGGEDAYRDFAQRSERRLLNVRRLAVSYRGSGSGSGLRSWLRPRTSVFVFASNSHECNSFRSRYRGLTPHRTPHRSHSFAAAIGT